MSHFISSYWVYGGDRDFKFVHRLIVVSTRCCCLELRDQSRQRRLETEMGPLSTPCPPSGGGLIMYERVSWAGVDCWRRSPGPLLPRAAEIMMARWRKRRMCLNFYLYWLPPPFWRDTVFIAVCLSVRRITQNVAGVFSWNSGVQIDYGAEKSCLNFGIDLKHSGYFVVFILIDWEFDLMFYVPP